MGPIEVLWMAIPGLSIMPTNSLGILTSLAFLYLVALGVYRLYFSPSARFPGPKLAALTYWYEFYYDVWLEGQYTWKIRDLHNKYGRKVIQGDGKNIWD